MPIKDIKTYLQAIHLLRGQFPDLNALVLGPTDEQPEYYEACKAMVAELGLSDTCASPARSTSPNFPRIHVNVLTSLSESQPLSVLEAGAAGIPTVATNVGACREMLEGRRDEQPALGDGGILTDVASPEQTAEAIGALLRDPERRAPGANDAAARQTVLRPRHGRRGLCDDLSAPYGSAVATGRVTA